MKSGAERIDAAWDNYSEEMNLKALTQQRRGNGPRTRIGDGSTPIPKREWNSGLQMRVTSRFRSPDERNCSRFRSLSLCRLSVRRY